MVPGYKGEISSEECLACAANPETHRCQYDYGILRFIYRDRQDRPDVHVTDLTGCLRKAFFDKTRTIVSWAHQSLVLALGSITHGLLETEAEVDECEMAVDALGVKGTADRVHWVPGGARVVDYKTTRWLKPSNLPYGSHELQVNIYAQLLREQGIRVKSAAIQYIDLSGPTKCRKCNLPVIPDENGLVCPSCGAYPGGAHLGAVLYEVELHNADEIRALIEERRDTLVLALEMESPPEAEPGFLCNYCGHREVCQEGRRQVGEE